MIGKGDWNASGERWTVRCVDCQSMVPDLSPAVDGMNKRRTLMVIFNEVSARIKLRGMWYGSAGFWGEWKAVTCRYRFILMEANSGRETSVVSLMEFNDSIRVLSPLYRLLSKHSPHHNHHYLWKYGPFIRYSLADVCCHHLIISDQYFDLNTVKSFLYFEVFVSSFVQKEKHELGNERTVKAKESVLFRLQAAGYKRRSHTERLSTVLCWCTIFSLSSSILGRIWWHPFPFRVSPRDSLIYCLSGMPFFEGDSVAFQKISRQMGTLLLFFLWKIYETFVPKPSEE